MGSDHLAYQILLGTPYNECIFYLCYTMFGIQWRRKKGAGGCAPMEELGAECALPPPQ